MKTQIPKYFSNILTIGFVWLGAFEMRADGHLIPISDDAILAIQISLVIIAIGLLVVFAVLVRKFAIKRNLSVAKTYGVILLVACLFFGYRWWQDYKRWHPDVKRDAQGAPEKFPWVPDNAFWINDAEGGKWYIVEDPDSISKTAFFRIFNGVTGSESGGSRYILRCPDSTVRINWRDLKKEIRGYDGIYIILKKNDCYFQH